MRAPLAPHTTFGVLAHCAEIKTATSLEDLERMRLEGVFQGPHLVLGGGSNMLFTKDFDGTVVLIQLKGKTLTPLSDEEALVRVAAGENWHAFVLWTLEQGYGGLENLSLIPGNVGTAPIQNIGAYGVELKDVLESVTAFEKATGNIKVFSREECAFGYRESYFKGEGAGKYILTEVVMRVSKNAPLHTSYGAIQAELEAMGINTPSHRDVSNAVIRIRQSKLPDPAVLGNAGSFFKNPIVDPGVAEALKAQYPDLPTYPAEGGVKLAAGWLIEQAGWKGFRRGDAGVHNLQALVLVNHGKATGPEVWALATDLMNDVESKFGVRLQPEVNVL